MKCKHDWLFTKDIERTGEAYEKARSEYEKQPYVEQPNGLLRSFFYRRQPEKDSKEIHESFEKAFENLWLRQFIENGRKYVCANCGEVKEVF